MTKKARDLIQYVDSDPMADACAEVAATLKLSSGEAAALVARVLDSYHFKRSDYPADVPQDVYGFVIEITSMFRHPHMTDRFDSLISNLDGTGPTVLDYGGGGGKDAIMFARLGKRVTYADLLSSLTPLVERRFALRNLNVEVVDVRDLRDQRYDIVNCMDVIEHCYDVEYVTADVLSRLSANGHLFLWPTFLNSWNGDHVEKNCGYTPYYSKMLSEVGFAVSFNELGVYHVIRNRPVQSSVADERQEIRSRLYGLSARWSLTQAARAALELPARVAFKFAYRGRFRMPLAWAIAEGFSPVIDNLAIWRLSKHRIHEAQGHHR